MLPRQRVCETIGPLVMSRKSGSRTWYRLLKVGPLFLVLALAPSLLYVDHWGEAGHEPATSAHIGAAETTSNQAHCHASPGSCSEQPAPAKVQVFPSVVELAQPKLHTTLLEDSEQTLEEVSVSPPTEPPRL